MAAGCTSSGTCGYSGYSATMWKTAWGRSLLWFFTFSVAWLRASLNALSLRIPRCPLSGRPGPSPESWGHIFCSFLWHALLCSSPCSSFRFSLSCLLSYSSVTGFCFSYLAALCLWPVRRSWVELPGGRMSEASSRVSGCVFSLQGAEGAIVVHRVMNTGSRKPGFLTVTGGRTDERYGSYLAFLRAFSYSARHQAAVSRSFAPAADQSD